ncbi:hypothetical protein GGU10DRAFT_340852 [Lentinula aff. detonsa]|uniref:DUF4048 domain-containing protein n=1 Tax=Lentinula aff. detonsa TaxID=2804958 RepID=A0AA38U0B4_9AGAR|nr:hypothetical protein GGU10DRAFT_340852 [Lentinula aff. detonsa]
MTTSGPRPLRLASSAESPTITSPTPLTPRSAGLESSKRISSFRSNSRRQSSISYNPPSRDDPLSPTLFSPRHATPILTPDSPGPSSRTSLSRSASVGSRAPRRTDFRGNRSANNGTDPSTPTSASWNRNRNSTGSLLTEERERPPLTLVEKHADLLHFIAQKESKCLELRTQLSAHEAELLQLKKKWERIVFRGYEKSQAQGELKLPAFSSPPDSMAALATHPPSASIYSAASLSYLDNLSTQAQGAGGVAMLEALGGMKGIRESVQQGVGRFLGAVAGTTDPSYANGHRKSLNHTPSLSSSSTSTYATSSTRRSQSSQSSFGDIVPTSISEEDGDSVSDSNFNAAASKKARKNRPAHIGIVSDTGATPLVSPTRDFAFESPPQTATPLKSANGISGGGEIRSRRKSRTFSSESHTELTGSSASEEPTGYADSDTNTSESLSSSLVDWGMGLSSPSPVDSQAPGLGKGKRNLNKRMSLPARALSSGSGAESWMGSMVGKRWEDTISKNQKRASVLLSDVSQSISQSIPQSIIQALVSPPLSASSELVPPVQSGTRRQNMMASASSTSLLDEDIPPEASGGPLTPLLELSPAPFPVLSPTRLVPASAEPQPKSPMKKKNGSVSLAGNAGNTSKRGSAVAASQEDDDDDWNW